MLPRRLPQLLLLPSLLTLSWLSMTLLHELGHVLAALATGGHVQRLIYHPLVLSRTDVSPNPHPLIVTWSGTLLGSLLPLLPLITIHFLRPSLTYLFSFLAGFCLLSNGLYLASAPLTPAGDSRELLRLGTPHFLLPTIGLPLALLGLYLLHRTSPRLGLGPSSTPVPPAHAYATAGAALLVAFLAFTFGDKGL